MNETIVALAAEAWKEVIIYLIPILVVFALGNRIVSMILNAIEGRNTRL